MARNQRQIGRAPNNVFVHTVNGCVRLTDIMSWQQLFITNISTNHCGKVYLEKCTKHTTDFGTPTVCINEKSSSSSCEVKLRRKKIQQNTRGNS